MVSVGNGAAIALFLFPLFLAGVLLVLHAVRRLVRGTGVPS